MQLFVRGLECVETLEVQQDANIAAVKVSKYIFWKNITSLFLVACSNVYCLLIIVVVVPFLFHLGTNCPTSWLQH